MKCVRHTDFGSMGQMWGQKIRLTIVEIAISSLQGTEKGFFGSGAKAVIPWKVISKFLVKWCQAGFPKVSVRLLVTKKFAQLKSSKMSRYTRPLMESSGCQTFIIPIT